MLQVMTRNFNVGIFLGDVLIRSVKPCMVTYSALLYNFILILVTFRPFSGSPEKLLK